MIQSLVAERQARRNEAASGIAEGWGKRQTISCPYIAIPYERRWKDATYGESLVMRLPVDAVEWTIAAEIGEKARGIYKARLYTARISAAGSVTLPARASLEEGTHSYKWSHARLVLGISDALGIRGAPEVHVDDEVRPLSPGSGDGATSGGLHVVIGALEAAMARTVKF